MVTFRAVLQQGISATFRFWSVRLSLMLAWHLCGSCCAQTWSAQGSLVAGTLAYTDCIKWWRTQASQRHERISNPGAVCTTLKFFFKYSYTRCTLRAYWLLIMATCVLCQGWPPSRQRRSLHTERSAVWILPVHLLLPAFPGEYIPVGHSHFLPYCYLQLEAMLPENPPVSSALVLRFPCWKLTVL
jgi:hypothetical protein